MTLAVHSGQPTELGDIRRVVELQLKFQAASIQQCLTIFLDVYAASTWPSDYRWSYCTIYRGFDSNNAKGLSCSPLGPVDHIIT